MWLKSGLQELSTVYINQGDPFPLSNKRRKQFICVFLIFGPTLMPTFFILTNSIGRTVLCDLWDLFDSITM